MTASIVSSSCRLTILSATQRIDLAVPVQMSVAELLAVTVQGLGRDIADQGVAEGGWVLQKAGAAPLDASISVAANGLRDGDVLHLRTRATNLPELAFDDVLDAVATGVLDRTSRWQPAYTRRMATVAAGLALVFALLTILSLGPSWTLPAIAAGAAAVLLVLAAAALSRVGPSRGPTRTAAGFAIAYAAVCGATSVGGDHRLTAFGAPQVLVAAAATVLVSTVLMLLLASAVAGLVTLVTLALLTAVGTAIAAATSLSLPATAAVVATVALALSPFLPTLSFKLSRLPLPSIPTDAADLRRDPGVIDAAQILGRSVRADQFLTGLVGGVALATGGAAVFVAGRGPSEYVLAGVLGAILLLRARLFTGLAQRTLLIVGGVIAVGACAVAGVLDVHGTARLVAFAVPAAILAGALLAGAIVLPERRYSPPLSRSADVLESLLVLSVIPLALAVMGVYGAVRHTGH